MRSITMKNIRYFESKGMAVGTPISLTSTRFIQGVLGSKSGEIYLQRGYRQYGDPHVG